MSRVFSHRGEIIVTHDGQAYSLASGGPKQVVAHPFGYYLGFDDRKALDQHETDVELGVGAYAAGKRIWPDGSAAEKFFDTYTDGRVVTEDAFHQALTWLVTP